MALAFTRHPSVITQSSADIRSTQPHIHFIVSCSGCSKSSIYRNATSIIMFTFRYFPQTQKKKKSVFQPVRPGPGSPAAAPIETFSMTASFLLLLFIVYIYSFVLVLLVVARRSHGNRSISTITRLHLLRM